MVNDWPLFDEPAPWRPELSKLYSTPRYRQTKENRARYVNLNSRGTIPCDECFANQHEGGTNPRAQATRRRSFLGGPKLSLCGPHAELWKERDAGD